MPFLDRSKTATTLALFALSLTACGGGSGGSGAVSTFPQVNVRCNANAQISDALRKLSATEISIDGFVMLMATTPNVRWTDTLEITATNSVGRSETPSATAGAPADVYTSEKNTTFITALNPDTGEIEHSAECGYSKTLLNGEAAAGSDMPETVHIGDQRILSTATYTPGKIVEYLLPNQLELGQEQRITTRVETYVPSAEEIANEKKDLEELKSNPTEIIRKMKAGLEETRRQGAKIEFKAYRGSYNGKIALIFVGNTEFRSGDDRENSRFKAAARSQTMQVTLGL